MAEFDELAKEALAPAQAPDSLVARYGLLTLKGIGKLPEGVMHAVQEDIRHPWQTLGMVAGSAALGAAVKTLLPKTGTYGKIAAAGIGAFMVYKASEPIRDAYSIAGQATSMNDINVAAKVFGDAGGLFLFNSALSGVAYKLGGMGAEKYLMQPKPGGLTPPKPDGLLSSPPETTPLPRTPVEPRGGVWYGSILPRLPGTISITSASSTNMTFNPRLAGIEKFVPSEQNPPKADFKGLTDASEKLSITVQLKSKASDKEMEETLRKISLGEIPNLTEAEYAEKFGASKESLEEVSRFAKAYGIEVTEADLRSGRVVLTGSAESFSEAFKTRLNQYDSQGISFNGRVGALFVPKSVAKNIEGVFGLDNRPQAQPRLREIEPKAPDGNAASPKDISFRADEVANAYNFPKGTTGKGQSAALIQLGGGIDMQNEAAFYKQYNLKVPDITVVEINGAKNATGKNLRADKEVSMDSQIVGAAAPDAKQMIIFAPNSEQGFIDAIGRASFPEKSESGNQAISISWGQPIDAWTAQGKRGMSLAFKKAALRGITVFAASGDDGAADGVADGKFRVDYPAADPYVTGTGGTKVEIKDGKIVSEVAWNDKHGSTGGGISSDAIPDYQTELKKIVTIKDFNGRAVPDVAGNASPDSGYKMKVSGRDMIGGGTSAVAPLYTALVLRVNEGLGGGNKTVGFINPFLYREGLKGNATFLNDITSGTNNGYDATKGWDPPTGWGSLDGEKLLALYKQLRNS